MTAQAPDNDIRKRETTRPPEDIADENDVHLDDFDTQTTTKTTKRPAKRPRVGEQVPHAADFFPCALTRLFHEIFFIISSAS